jgi:hypothetical protein
MREHSPADWSPHGLRTRLIAAAAVAGLLGAVPVAVIVLRAGNLRSLPAGLATD